MWHHAGGPGETREGGDGTGAAGYYLDIWIFFGDVNSTQDKFVATSVRLIFVARILCGHTNITGTVVNSKWPITCHAMSRRQDRLT